METLNRLLPKQADEVERAISAAIPIMIINRNASADDYLLLSKELKKAGAILLPTCIRDYKKENTAFMSIYLNRHNA